MKTHKFSEITALRIRQRFEAGESAADLAREYKVTPPTIRSTARRAKYAIPPENIKPSDLEHMIAHAKEVIMNATKGTDIKAATDALERLLALRKIFGGTGGNEETPKISQKPKKLKLRAM